MIRTEELLAARRIDGGRQYFTRAFDFGFSKTIDETYEHWPKDSILKDMVAIVRAFRPQVIIAVWSGTPQDGHGHHQYSGVLAREVFDAAADSVRFPRVARRRTPAVDDGEVLSRAANGRRVADASTSASTTAARRELLGDRDGEPLASIARRGRAGCRSAGRASTRCDSRCRACLMPTAPTERGLFDGLDSEVDALQGRSARRLGARARSTRCRVAERLVRQALDLDRSVEMVEPLARYVRLASRAASGVTCTTLTSNSTQPRVRGRDRRSRARVGVDTRSRDRRRCSTRRA